MNLVGEPGLVFVLYCWTHHEGHEDHEGLCIPVRVNRGPLRDLRGEKKHEDTGLTRPVSVYRG